MAESVMNKTSRWFSENPDKGWVEKFFLTSLPVWFVYSIAMHGMG